MIRYRNLLLCLGVTASLLAACKADKEEEKEQPLPAYKPTPMQVHYPAWVTTFAGAMPVPADNPLTVEGVALGRKLFYEKKLSDNMTQSCASCHKIENAFSDPRKFSEGTNGALGDRNAMAIFNLAWNQKFFWDGRRNSLEEQAHDPVTNPVEMRNTWPVVVQRLQQDPSYPTLFYKAFGTYTIDSNLVVKAIAQFERTLVSFNSRFDKYYFEGDSTVFSEAEKRGYQIFMRQDKGDCNHCHTGVLMSDNGIRNNGLDLSFTDRGLGKVTGLSSDDGKFKVTSLRNIALTAPYMHDSRFNTLMEVINQYDHNVKAGSPNLDPNMDDLKKGVFMSTQEKNDLLAFLLTMTDSSFINNPDFKAP